MKLALFFLMSALPAAAMDLVVYETCDAGKQAFEKTVHRHVRTHCIKCHEQGPGPRFAVASVDESYEILLAKTNFAFPAYSRFQTKGGDGHCLDNGYDCKTGDKTIGNLIAEWWKKGQASCTKRVWKKLDTKTIDVAELPGRVEFDLGVEGAKLAVEVSFKEKTSTLPHPLYVIKKIKITAGDRNLKIRGIQFLLNDVPFGYPDSFASIEARISPRSTQTLSAQSVVIPKTTPGVDQLQLAMEIVQDLESVTHDCHALDLFQANVYPLMDYRCSVCHGVSHRVGEKMTGARKVFPVPIEGAATHEAIAQLCNRSLERIEAPVLMESPLFRLAFGGDKAHRGVASFLDTSIPKNVKKVYPDWFEWALKEREEMERR